ncbi:MAG TPA: hypothetical protein VK574_14075 [Terracidiphilus sp.]|nr:hypothetical protein [Terracidiphilus sp.]
MFRILIGMLADIEDLELVLRKIADRSMVLVSRDHIQHHLAGGDAKDHRGLGLSGGRSFLRGHRKAERRKDAGR